MYGGPRPSPLPGPPYYGGLMGGRGSLSASYLFKGRRAGAAFRSLRFFELPTQADTGTYRKAPGQPPALSRKWPPGKN
jgi:hypothetical protein